MLGLRPAHATFVGIDSDGCVFDTMELKQKQCFHPLIIAHWRLEPIAAAVREVAEFTNLYSRRRGRNRFESLLTTFEMLSRRPDVAAAGVALPALDGLRDFVASGVALGDPALRRRVLETGNPGLASVLAWSEAVNARVAEVAGAAPPFPGARQSLERIRRESDAVCVSQTPFEALVREWTHHGLAHCVSVIAGQEVGSKAEHIRAATRDRYAPDRILMIGDAPGDMETARATGVRFYPIAPTREAECWARFRGEAYDRFLAGTYAGTYERERIAEFLALLPETPPWEASPACD